MKNPKVVKIRQEGKDKLIEYLENNLANIDQMYIVYIEKDGMMNWLYSNLTNLFNALGALTYIRHKIIHNVEIAIDDG